MLPYTAQQKIYFILRWAAAMCFIGHGAFGIITKPVWCNYFGVFGIGQATAYRLMPVIGTFDIMAGFIMLLYPIRLFAFWLVVWGLFTAALRPLAGEPFPEMIERAGNFGAPVILLILCGTGKGVSSWISRMIAPHEDQPGRLKIATHALRFMAFLLMAGHGWLNLIGKKALIAQYTALGFHHPYNTALIAGIAEIAMALMVLIKPVRSLVLFIVIWKISTELFYPHWELFEWIERGGSYGILLALWFATCRAALQGLGDLSSPLSFPSAVRSR